MPTAVQPVLLVMCSIASVVYRLIWIAVPILILREYSLTMEPGTAAFIVFWMIYTGVEIAGHFDDMEAIVKGVLLCRLVAQFIAGFVWVRLLLFFDDPDRKFLKWFVLVCSAVSWLAFWFGQVAAAGDNEFLAFFLNNLVDGTIGWLIGWFTLLRSNVEKEEEELGPVLRLS
jgi:hypothetical protein